MRLGRIAVGRLYVLVDIYGVKFFGLLDSRATVSIIGGKAWSKLSKFNRICIIGGESWDKLQRSNVHVTPCKTKHVKVANGQTCPVLGRVDAPVVIDGRMKVCSFLVVADLPQDILLGLDFWRVFGLLPDVVKGTFVLAEADLPVINDVIVPADRLHVEERAPLDSVVSRYRETLGRRGLGCTNLVEHTIDTGDAKPIRQRYNSYSLKLLDVLHTGLEEWLSLGVVEPLNSPWASAVLLVKEKDGSYRWVVDLRALNKLTTADSYPLPKVNDILDQLRDARYISCPVDQSRVELSEKLLIKINSLGP